MSVNAPNTVNNASTDALKKTSSLKTPEKSVPAAVENPTEKKENNSNNSNKDNTNSKKESQENSDDTSKDGKDSQDSKDSEEIKENMDDTDETKIAKMIDMHQWEEMYDKHGNVDILSDAHAMAGWANLIDSEEVTCVVCHEHRFVPQMRVMYDATKMSIVKEIYHLKKRRFQNTILFTNNIT